MMNLMVRPLLKIIKEIMNDKYLYLFGRRKIAGNQNLMRSKDKEEFINKKIERKGEMV